MQHLSVVVAQKDHAAAQRLARALEGRFRHVAVAPSGDDIESTLLKNRAQALIVDLKLLNRDKLEHLCREFTHTAVVATQRSPDEDMWMACLQVGAADCLDRSDVDGMLRAISHTVPLSRSAHAA
jgi:DNA-binding response OmpR family regulator